MASENKIATGLLFKLIAGIFVPILLAFAFLGCVLFLNVDLGAFKFTSIRGIWSNSMNELGAASLKEATTSLNKLGEQVIREKAEAVAKEIEIYYKSFKKAPSIEQLRNDPVMKEICIQKVGETGYTAVHSTSAITYWHAQPNMIGMDLHGLATKLPEFWKILEVGLTGKAVAGYYNWKEPNGSIRKKYMANVPVKGTNLVSSLLSEPAMTTS